MAWESSLLSQLSEMFQNYLQKTLEAYHIPTSWEEPDSFPHIADADRSMLSWTRPPEFIGSDLIGVDCSLANPTVLGGEVTSVPATAEGVDGATTNDNPS
jgi:hypothetical protein